MHDHPQNNPELVLQSTFLRLGQSQSCVYECKRETGKSLRFLKVDNVDTLLTSVYAAAPMIRGDVS
jgi:hypothetical protein